MTEPEGNRTALEVLLSSTREAFLTDPGYATAIAQKAVETQTRKDRRTNVDCGDS